MWHRVCNYCGKVIKNNPLKIGRGSLVLNRSFQKRFYSACFYHKGCYRLISKAKQKQQKKFWILLLVIIFAAFALFLIIMTISGSFK